MLSMMPGPHQTGVDSEAVVAGEAEVGDGEELGNQIPVRDWELIGD